MSTALAPASTCFTAKSMKNSRSLATRASLTFSEMMWMFSPMMYMCPPGLN